MHEDNRGESRAAKPVGPRTGFGTRARGRRSLAWPLLLLFGSGGTLAGCASQKPKTESLPEPTLELAYDDGQASQRPLLPAQREEWLVRFDPGFSTYRAHRLRLLVAQPGVLHLALYAADSAGRPGSLLHETDKTIAAELSSNGSDGKWALESLLDVKPLSGPLFVGVSVVSPGPTAARLWVSSATSEQVFQRDPEPGTAQQSTRLPFTPLLRLEVVPAAPATR